MPEQNNYFIIAAFVVTWLCVVGYAAFLLRARRAADQRFVEAQRMFGGES